MYINDLAALFRYDYKFIDDRLLRATAGFDPKRPDWGKVGAKEASGLVTEVASDIYSLPFMKKEWCELLILFADLVDSYTPETIDGRFAAPEVRLRQISPILAQAFHYYLAAHISPIIFHLWSICAIDVEPPFVTKYSLETVRRMELHHDNASDVTLSLILNNDFSGGGTIVSAAEILLEGSALRLGSNISWEGHTSASSVRNNGGKTLCPHNVDATQ